MVACICPVLNAVGRENTVTGTAANDLVKSDMISRADGGGSSITCGQAGGEPYSIFIGGDV